MERIVTPTLARPWGRQGQLAVRVNPIENAVEYARVESPIVVQVAEVAGEVRVSIANAAPDLTAADVAGLFDRFWGQEAAHGGGGAHVGLGLSLARAFAETVGWTPDAARDKPVGNRDRVGCVGAKGALAWTA